MTRRTSVLRVAVAAVISAALAVGMPIATGAPAVAAPDPVGAGLHENGSAAIVTTGSWRTSESPDDSGGSISYASRAATASLAFEGTGVTWISRMSAHSGIDVVTVDGVEVARVDRYSAETRHAVPVFVSDPLPPGAHTITVSSTGERNPDAADGNLLVDAFAVEDAPPQDQVLSPLATQAPADAPASDPEAGAGVGIHQTASSGISFSGPWRSMASRSDSGGSSQYLNAKGSASLSFTGTSVQWLSRVTPSAGIADVYLDGRKVASVDRYSSGTAYQRTVFARSGLSAGSHTIKIVWTGKKSARSEGTNLVVDAIVVPDVTPPTAPTGVVVRATGTADARISWNAVADSRLASYRVYVGTANGGTRLVGQTLKGTTAFRSLGLPSSTSLSYRVTAVDSWGNESKPSSAAGFRTARTPSGAHRADDCPTATTTVRTVEGLQSAVRKARPGTVIRLAAGTYRGQLKITATGTAAKPVWICGSRSAVIDGGGYTENSPIDVSNSSHLVVTGMTARHALKGVTVRGSDHVTISDMLVEDIGYEGIHLRSLTTDSTVVGNTVRRTGQRDAFYGEGIYIGSSKNNWCALTKCAPDRSDRIAVIDNSVSRTGSDPIEVKEGSTAGVVAGNDIDGTGAMTRTESFIKVAGNDWVVSDNTARESRQHGVHVNASLSGWGLRAVLVDNIFRVDAAGYGIDLWEPSGDGSTKALVSCENTVMGADSGFSNISCAD